jgi:hypothetical protein
MSESDKKSIAALLYVTLRRVASRVIDVEWMVKNEEYAHEIIRLARQQNSEELTHYADRYEELAFGKPLPAKAAPVAPPAKSPLTAEPTLDDKPEGDGEAEEGEGALPGHYIGALR